MKTIHVHTSAPYRVMVGCDLLSQAGAEIRQVTKAERIAIVSDDHVWPIYGSKLSSSLLAAGFVDIVHFVFPAGESSKNGRVYLELLEFLAINHITRTDCLAALGGGVVGDMTGFAAATYLRGIDFVQIPTSLLAAVDSSVGGKTGIDLSAGKNLAGAFYQPKLVLCDIDTLQTLPEQIFIDGCAEVIKYGILYDQKLFDHLRKYGLQFSREDVVARCIELKRDVVCQDEFDRGERQKLNLGHTIGHGIEANSEYTVSHGQAISIGIAVVSRAAAKAGFLSPEAADRIVDTLKLFGLPVQTEFDAALIFRSALTDKKRSGSIVNLIVPTEIGHCMIHPTNVSELEAFIQAGL